MFNAIADRMPDIAQGGRAAPAAPRLDQRDQGTARSSTPDSGSASHAHLAAGGGRRRLRSGRPGCPGHGGGACSGTMTISRVATFAFSGIEAMPVEVQVQIAPGMPGFLVVGLPDKAVGEAGSGCAPP